MSGDPCRVSQQGVPLLVEENRRETMQPLSLSGKEKKQKKTVVVEKRVETLTVRLRRLSLLVQVEIFS